MSTSRPFAYNTGSLISGTTQVGVLAVGFPVSGFTNSPQFWNGPNEELGYVIAVPVSGNTQPTPVTTNKLYLSPTYKATDIALSNNNQTATQVFSYQQSVLGETPITTSDKVMFSVRFNSTNISVGGGGRVIGIGRRSMNYEGPFNGYPGNDDRSYGFSDNGDFYSNGSIIQSSLPTWNNEGDIIDITVDNVGGYLWVRVNGGNWNNSISGNPSTNSGGISIDTTTWYPALCPYIYGSMTIQNYPTYGVPSGYLFLGNTLASLKFFRSANLTDGSFINIAEYVANQNGTPQTFTGATEASNWLTTNGFWNSYNTSVTCDSFTFNSINANTTINSVIKTSAGGWDGSAYSVQTYTNPVTLTFQTTNNGNYLMGGFSYSPTGNTETYTNTTYGLYIQPGFLEIYENGGQVTVPGAMVNLSTDVWKVEYNGTNVSYYKNDILIYTSSNLVTQPLHVFFALLTDNEGVTDVCFTEV
jgi:hypothetical protein